MRASRIHGIDLLNQLVFLNGAGHADALDSGRGRRHLPPFLGRASPSATSRRYPSSPRHIAAVCGQVGALAKEQVQVRHRVIVGGVDFQRLLEVGDSVIEHPPVLAPQLLPDSGSGSGPGSQAQSDPCARRCVRGIPLRPCDHTQTVVALLNPRICRNHPLIPGLRLVELP